MLTIYRVTMGCGRKFAHTEFTPDRCFHNFNICIPNIFPGFSNIEFPILSVLTICIIHMGIIHIHMNKKRNFCELQIP